MSTPRAHSVTYWCTVGWWWEPLCWSGRVMLWLFAWPVGLWRSHRHAQRNDTARAQRNR